MRNARLFSALFAAGSLAPIAAESQEIPLHAGAVVRFATIEEGAAVLGREDAFTRELSRFDLQSRLRTREEVGEEDLRQFAARQAQPWSEAEIAAITPLVASLREKLKGFPPLFPETVLLIKTTGAEEAGAAYCRQYAIVLPQSMVDRRGAFLERLLAHELFHILSRHDSQRRDRLYAVVGFHPAGAIELPPSLADRKITNPDAPTIEHYVELPAEGGAIAAAPILFASVASFDPTNGESFFRVMQFRLMQLTRDGDRWRAAVDENGAPVLLDAKQTPAYFERIGRNTEYIIHPEEILADNFAHLLLGARDLKTPRIVEELRDELEKR
jgi:hypothetical protein